MFSHIKAHTVALSISGMLSHQLKKHVIDGEKAIIQNPTENHR